MRVSGISSLALDRPAVEVGQVAQRDRRLLRGTVRVRVTGSPAQGRPDAGDELRHLERLADVVVGARLEADDDVDRVSAGREHHDRRRGLAPDRAAHLEAVETRQHDVEQDEVGAIRPPAIQALDAAAAVVTVVRRAGQGGHLADRGSSSTSRI